MSQPNPLPPLTEAAWGQLVAMALEPLAVHSAPLRRVLELRAEIVPDPLASRVWALQAMCLRAASALNNAVELGILYPNYRDEAAALATEILEVAEGSDVAGNELIRQSNAHTALAARVAELEDIITDAVFNRVTAPDHSRTYAEIAQSFADARTADALLVREAEAIQTHRRAEAAPDPFEDTAEDVL